MVIEAFETDVSGRTNNQPFKIELRMQHVGAYEVLVVKSQKQSVLHLKGKHVGMRQMKFMKKKAIPFTSFVLWITWDRVGRWIRCEIGDTDSKKKLVLDAKLKYPKSFFEVWVSLLKSTAYILGIC